MSEQHDATSPVEEQKAELDHIGEEIDEVRDRLAEEHGEKGPRFIDVGEESEDQPVDDTIAPPG